MWGSSFLLIKLAVVDMSPTVLVLVQTASAALTLLVISLVMRRSPTPTRVRRRIISFVFMAVFSSVVPFIAISWGELSVSTDVTSLLNATTPIWTAGFAFWVTPHERPTSMSYWGVALGFSGTAILLAPNLISRHLSVTLLGMLAILTSSASYAAAAVYQRRKLAGISPLEASLWQMSLAAIIMLPLAAPTIAATRIHFISLVAAFTLGVVFGFGYLIYYYLLNTLGATRAATVAFLIPVTAIFWGATVLSEQVTAPILAGGLLIFAAIFLTSRRRKAKLESR